MRSCVILQNFRIADIYICRRSSISYYYYRYFSNLYFFFIIAEIRNGANPMGGIDRQRESEVNKVVRVASGGESEITL